MVDTSSLGAFSGADISSYADAARQSREASKLDDVRRKFAHIGSKAEARKIAEEFESVFLAQMMEYMFAGIESDGLFGAGNSEEVYRSFLYEEYGKSLAANGGFGVADQLYADIVKFWNENNIDPDQLSDAKIQQEQQPGLATDEQVGSNVSAVSPAQPSQPAPIAWKALPQDIETPTNLEGVQGQDRATSRRVSGAYTRASRL